MNEGTKLSIPEEVPQKKESRTQTGGLDLKGTRLGEMSEFEKSLVMPVMTKPAAIETQPQPITLPPQTQTTLVQPETTLATEPTPVSSSQQETVIEKPAKEEKPKPAKKSSENLFAQEMEKMDIDYREGDIIKGTIRSVEKSGVYVDFGYKSDGFVSNIEFSAEMEETPLNTVKAGDEINVYILKLESKEGYTLLSRKRAEYEIAWNILIKSQKTRDSIDVKITSKVQGGLVASYHGIKGFLPASQILQDNEEDLETFVNQKLNAIVLQVDRKRKKIIFSTRQQQQKNKKKAQEALLESLEVGQVIPGRVSSIKDFGAFIDLGGLEGLVHISEMSWARVSHPSELLKVGETVDVFVLGIDKKNNRISLGMKQLKPDPWVNVTSKYHIDQIVNGTVSRIVPFGAFIRLEDNLEGLIHISELSYDHIKNVEDVVRVSNDVKAKIIKLIPEEQKIGLSLKGIEQDSETAAAETAEAVMATPEVTADTNPASGQ